MVVLTEEFHGLTLKRKGAHEPALFDVAGDDRSGFPLSCRATKMRRLEHDSPAIATDAAPQGDVAMGDASVPPPPGAGGEEERALVVYGGGGGPSDASRGVPRGLALRAGAEWVRAMLREADSRTVRELLAGAAREQGSDLALALVPWAGPSAATADEAEPCTAGESLAGGGDGEGAAAMDVEDCDDEEQGRPWAGQARGAAEGFVYRWPQHCMAPPQMPAVAVAQASPVMWSW